MNWLRGVKPNLRTAALSAGRVRGRLCGKTLDEATVKFSLSFVEDQACKLQNAAKDKWMRE